jgi:hypothetical protein
MKVDMSFLADGESGEWNIETFTVPKEDSNEGYYLDRLEAITP